MIFTLFIITIWVVISIIHASFFEWTLHKYFMHKTTFGIEGPFQAHAVVHHQVFKADHTYHLQRNEDKKTIPMRWWHGPALVASSTLIAQTVLQPLHVLCFGYLSLTGVITMLVTIGLYFGTYERLHWCMHLPKKRVIQMLGPIYKYFRKINGHHLLHHRYMHKNYNVVLPIADFCLGTLMRRSPTFFKQAQGQDVPDVQPVLAD